MQPVTAKSHHIYSSKYNNNSSSTAGTFTDEQIRNMAAPKRINGLQWSLSTPQERREMLDNPAYNADVNETDSSNEKQKQYLKPGDKVVSIDKIDLKYLGL